MNFFQKIDILGKIPALTIKGNTTYQTACGGFLSLIFYLVLSFIIYIYIDEFIDSTSPQVTVSYAGTSKYPRVEIGNQHLLPAVGINNGEDLPINLSLVNKYITPIMRIIKLDYSAGTSDFINSTTTTEIIKFTFCKNIDIGTHYKDVDNDQSAMLYVKGFCLCPDINSENLDRIFIENKISMPPFNRISFDIFPCSLDDPSKCATTAELDDVYLYYMNTVPRINISDFNTPMKREANSDDAITINLGSTQITKFTFMNNLILNDFGIFSPVRTATEYNSVEKRDYFTQHRDQNQIWCSFEQIKSRKNCKPYLRFDLRAGGETKTLTRKYPFILDTFGNIGGMAEVMIIIINLIYAGFNSYSMMKYIIKQVYSQDEPDLPNVFKFKNYARNIFFPCLYKKMKKGSFNKIKGNFNLDADKNKKEVFQNKNREEITYGMPGHDVDRISKEEHNSFNQFGKFFILKR